MPIDTVLKVSALNNEQAHLSSIFYLTYLDHFLYGVGSFACHEIIYMPQN